MAKKIFDTAFDTYSEARVIGNGGSGTVYEVISSDSKSFALKLLSPESASSIKLRRFKNELNFCLLNTHKNVIKVLEYGFFPQDKDKLPFFVMPFFPKTLRHLIDNGAQGEAILSYFFQILNGVEFAHNTKTWHRDLKPENILWDETRTTVVVADFGIAHFEEDLLFTAVETHDRERLANFQYAAPEQRIRDGKIDGRADIYALGMILNQLFTKSLPLGTGFKKIGESSAEYAFLDPLIDKMLRYDPADRPQTIGDIKLEISTRQKIAASGRQIAALQQASSPQLPILNPIYHDPIKVIGGGYEDGGLAFTLNQPVDSSWVGIFNEITYADRVDTIGEPWFKFRDNSAHIVTGFEKNHQKIIDDFKEFVARTNDIYKSRIDKEREERIRTMEKNKEMELQYEQKTKQVLEKIKF